MVLNVTENKQNIACSYTKTDRCMNEFGRSVKGQTLLGEGGARPVVITHLAPW